MSKQRWKQLSRREKIGFAIFGGLLLLFIIILVVPSTLTEPPPGTIDYEILREWDLPAGGIGMELLVSETATKAQVLALANYLRSKHSRGWINISIYDSREAHTSSFQGTLTDEEFLKHVLVSIVRNPSTGYDRIEWLATERGY